MSVRYTNIILTIEWYGVGPSTSDEELTCFVCHQARVDGEVHFQGNGIRFTKGIHEECRLRTQTLQALMAGRRSRDEP